MDNQKLNQYLYELDKHLTDLSAADRSKIIVEIEQHIQDSLKNYSDKSLAQILEDLGPAKKVANHYRLDRGLKTFKPQKHPLLKWLSIMFLGGLGLFLVFILVLVWKFTPVFEIDDKEQRIVILGGLIDINGTSGKVKIMDEYKFVENKFTNKFDGTIEFPKSEFDELVINFKSGILNLNPSQGEKLTWDCKLETPPNENFIDQSKGSMIINLEEYKGIDCSLNIPNDIELTVDGKDAQITITDAMYDTYVEIDNGQVFFNYNPEVDYNYDLNVDQGYISKDFISSPKKEAYEVHIYIKNGSIKKF